MPAPQQRAATCDSVQHRCAVLLLSTRNVTRMVVCDSTTSLQVDDLQDGDARQELHALGFVDGHEGLQSLSVKFYLQLGPQKGSDMGTKR